MIARGWLQDFTMTSHQLPLSWFLKENPQYLSNHDLSSGFSGKPNTFLKCFILMTLQLQFHSQTLKVCPHLRSKYPILFDLEILFPSFFKMDSTMCGHLFRIYSLWNPTDRGNPTSSFHRHPQSKISSCVMRKLPCNLILPRGFHSFFNYMTFPLAPYYQLCTQNK